MTLRNFSATLTSERDMSGQTAMRSALSSRNGMSARRLLEAVDHAFHERENLAIDDVDWSIDSAMSRAFPTLTWAVIMVVNTRPSISLLMHGTGR